MEKNCQKRRQPLNADSVIARLMGIDELPHQQLHKYQRVLSDGYICKSACVGLRQGSSISIRRSRDANNEMLQGVKDACGVKMYKNKNQFVPDKYTSNNTTTLKMVISNQKPSVALLSKSPSEVSHEDRKAIVRNSEHGAPGNVLRYLQKLDNNSSTDQFHCLGAGYTNDFFTIHSDRIDNSYSSSCVSNFKPQLVTTSNYFGVTKLDLLSRSEIGDSLRPESDNNFELAYKELSDNDVEPPRHSFIGHNRSTNRRSRQQRCRSNLQDLSRLASEGKNYLREPQASLSSCSGVYDDKNYNDGTRLLICKSSLAQEKLQKNNERLKIENEIEKIEVSGRGQAHVKMEAFAKMEPTPKYLNTRLDRTGLFTQSCKQSRNSGSTSLLGIGCIEVWEKDHIGNLPNSESETTKESLSTSSGGKINEEKEILKNGCWSGCQQLSSPSMNSSILRSATNVEVSCCYSCRRSEYIKPDACAKAFQDEMEDSCENDWCREIERGPGVSRLSNNYAVADVEASSGGVLYKISGDPQPESNSDFLPVKDVFSAYSQEASSGEALLYEFSDVGSDYSNCSKLVFPEFHKQLEGPIGHCSPDSVLESFHAQHPSTFECFESTGQQSQFQVFNSESEKAYSEGSEMAVSGNEEENEEGIADPSHNCGKVRRWLGDDESRNFCYIVDVLDGAGICYKERSIIDTIKSWDSLKCPINPLVFEALEKKNGTQACWQKSDRQLLFDLINSGLAAILKRLLIFQTCATSSLQRHLIAGMKRDEVEDMLWKMVIRLEREKSIDASEKVVDGAMKLWEVDVKDINVICRELEISLFEELVMESISLWFE